LKELKDVIDQSDDAGEMKRTMNIHILQVDDDSREAVMEARSLLKWMYVLETEFIQQGQELTKRAQSLKERES